MTVYGTTKTPRRAGRGLTGPNRETVNSESVNELLEEGKTLEAEAVEGVEDALDADHGRSGHTKFRSKNPFSLDAHVNRRPLRFLYDSGECECRGRGSEVWESRIARATETMSRR